MEPKCHQKSYGLRLIHGPIFKEKKNLFKNKSEKINLKISLYI